MAHVNQVPSTQKVESGDGVLTGRTLEIEFTPYCVGCRPQSSFGHHYTSRKTLLFPVYRPTEKANGIK